MAADSMSKSGFQCSKYASDKGKMAPLPREAAPARFCAIDFQQ
jgi:hypothetical protein